MARHVTTSTLLALAAVFLFSETAIAIDYKISGQVNRMIRFADDGDHSDIQHLDNAANQTRLRLKGGEQLDGLKVGFKWETGLASNASDSLGINQTSNDDGGSFVTRHADLYFSGRWGKVRLGQGNGAARYAGRADNSGTELAHGNDFRHVSAIQYKDSGGFTVGFVDDVFTSYEGSRDDRLRYDSPKLGGLKLKVSHGVEDWTELGLAYSLLVGEMVNSSEESSSWLFGGGAEVDFRLGYTMNPRQPQLLGSTWIDSQWTGSGSVLLANGFNFTGAYGQQELNTTGPADENSAWYVKLGYKTGALGYSVDYGQSKDMPDPLQPNETADGTHYGLGVQYRLDKPGLDLYASYKTYQQERSVTGVPDPDDVNVFVVGSRIQFN